MIYSIKCFFQVKEKSKVSFLLSMFEYQWFETPISEVIVEWSLCNADRFCFSFLLDCRKSISWSCAIFIRFLNTCKFWDLFISLGHDCQSLLFMYFIVSIPLSLFVRLYLVSMIFEMLCPSKPGRRWRKRMPLPWLIDWLMQEHALALIDWLIDARACPCLDWLIDARACPCLDWLIDWCKSMPLPWLIDWLMQEHALALIDWLIDWCKSMPLPARAITLYYLELHVGFKICVP